ncbi:unnamed protein product [Trypanosoma congolense IL3000]|uniref:WGS project CAEQ00000000 data, annotated contig 359 n=1 Tax=Trypanosoma congolense (strain IL3000) TaxID=1068625 RepID=F9WF81_TRYCI|nr:unnamed protein product [Trypanosoma congolense IL3000]
MYIKGGEHHREGRRAEWSGVEEPWSSSGDTRTVNKYKRGFLMEKKPNIYRTRQSSHNYFRGIKQKKNQMEYVRFVCRLYHPKCGPSCPSIAEYGNPGLTIATAGYHCRLLFSYAHSSKKDPPKKKNLWFTFNPGPTLPGKRKTQKKILTFSQYLPLRPQVCVISFPF